MSVATDLLQRLAKLNVDRSHGQRKPHKPLLFLLALQRLVVRGEREVAFVNVERTLRPLLDLYAPPVKGSHQPALPYWHLQTDGVWELPHSAAMERTAKGFPTIDALRASAGRIPERYAEALRADPALAARAVQVLLDEHFAPSLQADLRATLGLEDLAEAYGMPSTLPRSMADQVAESPAVTTEFVASRRRKRDASFRAQVLAAYDQRCAVSGFQALLGGTLFCLEAAHVHWHSHGGPSTVANGLALTPTLHKLFDHGAWSLDDNRRVIVSRHFSGSDVALGELRALEGRPLRAPAPGYAPLDLECIRWHREPELGGVFRT